jgi:hypothetical protein
MRQLRRGLGLLPVVQVNPRAFQIVLVSTQTETGASPLECLCFGWGAGVLVISPLFSDSGMCAQAEDGDLTGDNDLANHLAFAFVAGFSFQRC